MVSAMITINKIKKALKVFDKWKALQVYLNNKF